MLYGSCASFQRILYHGINLLSFLKKQVVFGDLRRLKIVVRSYSDYGHLYLFK